MPQFLIGSQSFEFRGYGSQLPLKSSTKAFMSLRYFFPYCGACWKSPAPLHFREAWYLGIRQVHLLRIKDLHAKAFVMRRERKTQTFAQSILGFQEVRDEHDHRSARQRIRKFSPSLLMIVLPLCFREPRETKSLFKCPLPERGTRSIVELHSSRRRARNDRLAAEPDRQSKRRASLRNGFRAGNPLALVPHGGACIDHQVDREVRVLLKSFWRPTRHAWQRPSNPPSSYPLRVHKGGTERIPFPRPCLKLR